MHRRVVNSTLGFTLLLLVVACGREPALSPSPTLVSPSVPRAVPAGALVITNGLVIDGTGAAPIPDGIVVLQDARIVAVGRRTDFVSSDGVEVVDAKGGTILPGIINAHTHRATDPAARRLQFLLHGVTTICDMGAPVDSMPQFEQATTTPSARGFRAGPMITAPGGYPDIAGRGYHLNYEVANAEEARAAVVDLVGRGADVIKIVLEPGPTGESWPVLGAQEVKAVVEEAHAHGRLVRAHVTRASLLDLILEAKVDIIEHIPVPELTQADWEALTEDKDHLKLPASFERQLGRMIKQQVVMVPTLSAMPAVCSMNWYHMAPAYQSQCVALFLGIVRRYHDLGGVIALGNDYGTQEVLPGMPLGEMRFLLQAGLTPMEVIQAATYRAATVCGHGEALGTLEPGKLADVIVVDGNPLEDIEAMSRVTAIIQDGKVIGP